MLAQVDGRDGLPRLALLHPIILEALDAARELAEAARGVGDKGHWGWGLGRWEGSALELAVRAALWVLHGGEGKRRDGCDHLAGLVGLWSHGGGSLEDATPKLL